MASPFANVGLGMLGSEHSYMHGNLFTDKKGNPNPLGLALAYLTNPNNGNTVQLPPFSIGTLPTEVQGSAAPSDGNQSQPVPAPSDNSAATATNSEVPPQSDTSDAEEHPETQNVLKDLGLSTPMSTPVQTPAPITVTPISGVTPDVLTPRNPAQDQLAGEMAIAPPLKMNLPQYGKQGGGGMNALSALSSLASIFA